MEQKTINTLFKIAVTVFFMAGLIFPELSLFADAKECLPYALGCIAAGSFTNIIFLQVQKNPAKEEDEKR
ncbi:MAG: hypothetical protein HUJ54_01495 [Erysipelotrichaceae bacterium]|nr:hypothetical protein [Erysipelotrichaceae bacterium]